MRVGVDVSCWNNARGFGRFTRELLTQLFQLDSGHTFVALADQVAGSEFDFPGVEVVDVGAKRRVVDAAVADDRRSIGDVVRFCNAARARQLDAIYYPAVYSWFPPPRGVKSIVTFHDAIAEHFPDLVFPSQRHRLLWNTKTWLARQSATRIVTVSQTARSEIVKYLGVAPDKIDVLCEGASDIFRSVSDPALDRDIRARYALPGDRRLLVYVGGFAPHKNLLRLLNAFAHALTCPGGEPLALVLVGDPGGAGFHSEYQQMIDRLQRAPALSARVFWTGYVPDADLAVLLSNALALVMPSLSEGFGLPALEAMRCGTPVLAAKDGAVMEVAGSAGLPFDPYDVRSIAASILALATRPELEAALRHATTGESARNTWQRGARLLLETIDRVLAAR